MTAPALSEDPPHPSPPLRDLSAPPAALSAPPADLPVPPLAAESEESCWGVRRPGEPLRLPPPGAVVYVKVTAVVSPELFYVVMPFGTRPAQIVNADCEYSYRLITDQFQCPESVCFVTYGMPVAERSRVAGNDATISGKFCGKLRSCCTS